MGSQYRFKVAKWDDNMTSLLVFFCPSFIKKNSLTSVKSWILWGKNIANAASAKSWNIYSSFPIPIFKKFINFWVFQNQIPLFNHMSFYQYQKLLIEIVTVSWETVNECKFKCNFINYLAPSCPRNHSQPKPSNSESVTSRLGDKIRCLQRPKIK